MRQETPEEQQKRGARLTRNARADLCAERRRGSRWRCGARRTSIEQVWERKTFLINACSEVGRNLTRKLNASERKRSSYASSSRHFKFQNVVRTQYEEFERIHVDGRLEEMGLLKEEQ